MRQTGRRRNQKAGVLQASPDPEHSDDERGRDHDGTDDLASRPRP